jgi:hypothetical protein
MNATPERATEKGERVIHAPGIASDVNLNVAEVRESIASSNGQ